MLVLTQITVTTNLWLIRGLMFVLGWMMAQVMVPNQAASFAMISADSMGRASTFFNTMRQVGSATGVAILSTVLIGVGLRQGLGRDGIARPDRLPPTHSWPPPALRSSACSSRSPFTTAMPRRRSCGGPGGCGPHRTGAVSVPEGSVA